jgi:hypothetical protein
MVMENAGLIWIAGMPPDLEAPLPRGVPHKLVDPFIISTVPCIAMVIEKNRAFKV